MSARYFTSWSRVNRAGSATAKFLSVTAPSTVRGRSCRAPSGGQGTKARSHPGPAVNDDEVTTASIEAEFPGWETFQGVDRRWRARIRGATPPALVHGDDLVDLREEIIRKNSQLEELEYQERHRPEAASL